MRVLISSDCPSGWDTWLAELGLSASFTQTSVWAQVRQQARSAPPIFIEILGPSTRLAGALLHVDKQSPKGLSRRLIVARRRLTCFGGPALAWGSKGPVMVELLRAVTSACRQTGAHEVDFYGFPPLSPAASDPSLASVFEAFGYEVRPGALLSSICADPRS